MIAKCSSALLGAAILAAGTAPLLAADLYEPQVIEVTPEPVYEQPKVDMGGWYIRGDLDYHAAKWRGADYITYGPPPGSNQFTTGKIENSWSVGGGVGYKVNRYLRGDLTLDWLGDAKFRGSTTGTCGGVVCVSSDVAKFSALLMLANAYIDFGTWNRFSFYGGGGIGGAFVKWDDLRNTVGGITTIHGGASNWRFAWALMAGTSYCLTKNLKLDVGYRFSRIEGGRMFHYANHGGPGFDRGMYIHEGRAGLRYEFGGGDAACDEPEPIAYVPEPVEPPVYK